MTYKEKFEAFGYFPRSCTDNDLFPCTRCKYLKEDHKYHVKWGDEYDDTLKGDENA